MRKLRIGALLFIGSLLLLAGCAITSVSGKNNQAYITESPKSEVPKTEPINPRTEIAAGMRFINPKESHLVPAYYAKVRLPGIEPFVYAFTTQTGEQNFRVYAEEVVSGRTGFLEAEIHMDPKRNGRYQLKADGTFIDAKVDKPGQPIAKSADDPDQDKPIRDHWLREDGADALYSFRTKNKLFQYRRWAQIGPHEGFYPCNNVGVLILGGIPDAVYIDGKWVNVRILNPMTFAGRDTEETVPEVIIRDPEPTDPQTDPPRTEPVRTEPPYVAPDTEPPVTDPVTEPAPETEDPDTDDVVTEPPSTEPNTEEPTTEPPSDESEEISEESHDPRTISSPNETATDDFE